MERTELKTYVWEYFRWLQDLTGCHIEEHIASKKKSFAFNRETYEASKHLAKIFNSLNMDNVELAFVRCDNLLRFWFSEISFSMKGNFTSQGLRSVGKEFIKAAGYVDQYKMFYPSFAKSLLAEYQSTGLLDGDNNDVTIDNVGELACDLETVMIESGNTKYLRIYTLHRGEKPLDFDAPFKVNGTLVCSDNLDFLLSAFKPTDNDEIGVTLTMKIEEIIDYSYFMIFLQYKNTTFVITDSIEFGNPHNMVASRNPRRRSERREGETGLPYGVIDDIIKWREENKAIAKSNGESSEKPMELYVKNINEYMPASLRLVMLQIFKTMLKRVCDGNGEFPVVGTFDRMLVSQKLLGTTVDMKSDSFKSSFGGCNGNDIEEFQSEWILPDTNGEKTTLPAPIIRDLATMEEYRPDVLVTPEKAQQYADYFVAKREADFISKTMWDYYEANYMKERGEMENVIMEHLDSLLPYIFAGDEVLLVDIHLLYNRRDFAAVNGNLTVVKFSRLYYDTADEHRNHKWLSGDITASKKPNGRRHDKYCNGCGIETSKGAVVSFHHWKEFVRLLSVKRTDIPQSMRNYTAHYYEPYAGNSILDNVNPIHLLGDPFSRRNPNGFDVAIPFCGNCMRKMKKRYRVAENAVILFNSKAGEVDEVIPYSENLREVVFEKYSKLNK